MLPRILNNNNGNLAVLALLSCLLPSPASGLLNPEDYTPNATLVDFDSPGPSEAYASLSVPEGTPWCNGAPTFWMVGHQFDAIEKPLCKQPDGTWKATAKVEMDEEDAKSRTSGWKTIDRHGCTFIDVNHDGLKDVACVGGANWHRDFGYPELYITNPDGTWYKEIDHGLQKYPSMACRWIETLRRFDGSEMVFVTTSGVRRDDTLPNQHRMYRVLNETEVGTEGMKYFEEVMGPWSEYFFIGSPPTVGDFNNDGIDDLVVFGWAEPSHMYLQNADGTWTEVDIPVTSVTENWQGARIGNITHSPYNDLVISTGGFTGIQRYYVHVLKGIPDPPYFDFTFPYYSQRLGTPGLDVEIINVNDDDFADIYVVMMNLVDCDKNSGQTPTVDRARDILLVGKEKDGRPGEVTFDRVRMENDLRGCGGFVRKFGDDKTLVLANGNHEHNGYHYILSW